MAFRDTRDVPCPVCGAGVGKPCLLRSGKPSEEVHCTDRISAAAGIKPMTTPSVPYVPGRAASAPEPSRPGPTRDGIPPPRPGGSASRSESAAKAPAKDPHKAPPPARPPRGPGGHTGKEDAPRLQPALF